MSEGSSRHLSTCAALTGLFLLSLCAVPASQSCAAGPGPARTFHVDAAAGDDARDGLSPRASWRSLDKVNATPLRPGDKVLFRRGGTWRGQIVSQSGAPGAPITYGACGEGPKPVLLGSVAMDRPGDWLDLGGGIWGTVPIRYEPRARVAEGNQPVPLSVDVGNIIFDAGAAWGVKKWSAEDLAADGDYFYDKPGGRVLLRSPGNPAARHRSIELALRRHIIDQGGKSFVTYENLDLRYGAAHGIGGGATRGITVRACDISWIGGGHQFTHPGGRPVRFGNGIEFWGSARDCLVEGCRLWEIYDAALTNQGKGTNVQENITYRNNVIWNSEYSFEYWNGGPASVTRNIRFEHNTCADAGFGWGHAQRPDRNGRHLMFYNNPAQTSEFLIRGNIFSRATDSLLRLHGRDWTPSLTMSQNVWHQPSGPLLLWATNSVDASGFAAFMKTRGLGEGCVIASPEFVAPEKRDYRLAADSPARMIPAENGPPGALP